jgi:predicted nuclease with TOPRIM domain
MQAAAAAQVPEFSSLTEEQMPATEMNSKEAAELREKLAALQNENTALLKQFERQGEEIGILRGANEMHQARNKQLSTEVSDKCIEIGELDD